MPAPTTGTAGEQPTARGLASMTGHGEARADHDGVSVSVEVRSINNRHLKLGFRADPGYSVLEPQVEALVRQRVHRGAVQLGLRVSHAAAADDYRLNLDALGAYQRQLADHSPEAAATPIEALLTLPGVVEEQPGSR
ncbi:MAG: YicC/YloC family endoribonuclease, partial [Planctomycetota bacterium]